MRSRAYDENGVVHLTEFKGSQMPSCTPLDVIEESPIVLSPMFLPADVPLSCVKCIAIEAEHKQETEDDDD